MPIYEYKCPSCGRVFEEWVKLSEAHREEPCPECGTRSPRMISHTSFVLKGGGWYVTDYGYRKNIHETSDGSSKTSEKNGTGDTTTSEKAGQEKKSTNAEQKSATASSEQPASSTS